MGIKGIKFIKVISLLLLALSTSGCIFFMGSHAHYKEYSEAGRRVQRILVDRGICKKMERTSDCEFYFVGSDFGGFDFTVYGIKDSQVLEEIKRAVRSVFDENPRLHRVLFRAWASPHMEAINQREAPILKDVFTR